MGAKQLISLLTFLSLHFAINAQTSESCDCLIDTIGYSSFLETLNPDEDATFQFHVNGLFAVAYGVIGESSPDVVQQLIDNYPNVSTIIMYACPGSEDDDANLEASLKIHNHSYKMYLPIDGWIASGAVDMFLAGSTRVIDAIYEPVGVHSWSNGTNTATDYPIGHEFHQPYIDYYVSIGFNQQAAEDFYYFTINTAEAESIYWMNNEEIDLYHIRTCRYSNQPNYSISLNHLSLSADLADASYQWLDCNNNYSIIYGENNQTFTPTEAGNYAVEISETSCIDTSACSTYIYSKIENNTKKTKISIYPNPSNGLVNIVLNHLENVSIEVVNLVGEPVYNANGINCKLYQFNQITKAGIYFITIYSNSSNQVFKLIKIN